MEHDGKVKAVAGRCKALPLGGAGFAHAHCRGHGAESCSSQSRAGWWRESHAAERHGGVAVWFRKGAKARPLFRGDGENRGACGATGAHGYGISAACKALGRKS